MPYMRVFQGWRRCWPVYSRRQGATLLTAGTPGAWPAGCSHPKTGQLRQVAPPAPGKQQCHNVFAACLERVLTEPAGVIEDARILFGKGSGNRKSENLARGDPTALRRRPNAAWSASSSTVDSAVLAAAAGAVGATRGAGGFWAGFVTAATAAGRHRSGWCAR